MKRLLTLMVLAIPLLVGGCAPKPPETFLVEYFTTLILRQDRAAALALIQLPAGIEPAEGVACFAAEESWVSAVNAALAAQGAADLAARRRAWGKFHRDKWITWKRQHTTRTTATVRVRIEGLLFQAAKVEPAETLELNYVLIRLEDNTWRINKVEVADWERGGEFEINKEPATSEK